MQVAIIKYRKIHSQEGEKMEKSKKEKKALSVRIDERAVYRMKYYCSQLDKSEADFIECAINAYCDFLKLQRMGGMSLTLPNPQNFIASTEEKEKAVSIISDAANSLTNNNSGLTFGLHHIAGYAAERLFTDTAEQKAEFNENMVSDK